MHATRALTTGVFAALAGVGCNPSTFNSALDHAPVVVFTAPGSGAGSLFTLPLPPPMEPGATAAARMLVARQDTSYLAIAEYDQNGKVTLNEIDQGQYGSTPVYSAAVRSNGDVIIGTPRVSSGTDVPAGRIGFLNPTTRTVVGGALGGGATTSRLGISVAAGNVTGIPTGNFVVVADNDVMVLDATGAATLAASPKCQLAVALSDPNSQYAYRPVAVGDVLAGGLDEIVLAGLGKVVFVQWDPTTNTLSCPTSWALSTTSLVIADFDGDGQKDLAVGMPPDKVRIYFGPLDSAVPTVPSVTISNATSTGFGQRLAAYALPGQVASQLMVADPAGTAGGRSGVGRTLLFTISRAAPAPTDANATAIFFDSNGEPGASVFGSNLGGLMFNTALCAPGGALQLVPWATTSVDVLTFFNYLPAVPPPPTDPRCFALMP